MQWLQQLWLYDQQYESLIILLAYVLCYVFYAALGCLIHLAAATVCMNDQH
jgi:hypothetical protein